MQRFIFLMCLTAFVMTSQAFAQQMQQMEDVIHLKNGGLRAYTKIMSNGRQFGLG